MTRSLSLAALLLASSALASCAASQQAPVTPATPPAVPDDVAPELADFYTQVPQWTECGDLQCADVRVPLDCLVVYRLIHAASYHK